MWERDDTIIQPPCEFLGVNNPFFVIEPELKYNYTSQPFEWHLDQKIGWNLSGLRCHTYHEGIYCFVFYSHTKFADIRASS